MANDVENQQHNLNMTMKIPVRLSFILLCGALLAAPRCSTFAQVDDAIIELVRGVVQADRQETVAAALQLTDAEAEKFWPLYQQYRVEMDRVGDGLVNLVRRYAFHYPNVPEDVAKSMLKELAGLEKERVATRAGFLKKFDKFLPASKTLRFAQVENRLDLALRLELAAGIPLVPVEGTLTADAAGAVAIEEGVAGGVLVRTVEVTAAVIMIDKANRKVTLLSPDGFKTTVKASQDVANFDQIRVGDRLKVTATEELVVRLADPGESVDDQADVVVALAPIGAKPGALAAETVQIIGTITAMDASKRTATLKFEDGVSKTFPVRDDVDLARRKIGDRVVFQVTEMIAIEIEQP
jgi:hypothetical protein